MKTYDFKELFGFEFGERKDVTIYPEGAGNEFMITFKTPSHSEENVRVELPVMAFVFNRNILMETLREDGTLLYTSNRGFSYFVNRDGVDPMFGKWSGHPQITRKVRDTHLQPNTRYSFHFKRAGTDRGAERNPAAIHYYGTDQNQVELGNEIPMTLDGVEGFFVPND